MLRVPARIHPRPWDKWEGLTGEGGAGGVEWLIDELFV